MLLKWCFWAVSICVLCSFYSLNYVLTTFHLFYSKFSEFMIITKGYFTLLEINVGLVNENYLLCFG